MTVTVSAVIPTIGRPTLHRALRSVLAQTRPVDEILVVADTTAEVSLPADQRIRLLRPGPGGGPARCRQRGVEAAGGSVIALLDDDDEWHPDKLARQLAAAAGISGPHWIVSSRVAAHGPGNRRRTWPRRLIRPGQPVAEYLFRFTGLRAGGALLQTSTLCFPTDVARQVPWDGHAGAVKDEPTWLIRVQRAIPGIPVLQLPDVLSTYHVGHPSRSRDAADRTDDYIRWGLSQLASASPRVLGDYLCTNPVSAAVSAGSLTGVARAITAAVRFGRPGPQALTYAGLNAARIAARRAAPVKRP